MQYSNYLPFSLAGMLFSLHIYRAYASVFELVTYVYLGGTGMWL